MARVIPAFVVFEDGETPKLQVAEHGADLSASITEMGLEVEEGSLDLTGNESIPHAPGSEIDPSQDLAEVDGKPRNGWFRSCMAAELARPEGAEKLSQHESRNRFKESAQACSARRAELEVEEHEVDNVPI